MSERADWAAGQKCGKHDLAYCGDCLDQAKLRRTAKGEVAYRMDCAVQTFCEITGAEYDEAAELMLLAGFKPGKGTVISDINAAFAYAGYRVREVTGTLKVESACRLSQSGRCFWVSGWKNGRGHAWSISDGTVRRAYLPPYRFRIFEVTP